MSDPGNGLCLHLLASIYGFILNWVALPKHGSEGQGQTLPNNLYFIFVAFPLLNGVTSESDGDLSRCLVNTLICSVTSIVTSYVVAMAHDQFIPTKVMNIPNRVILNGCIAASSCATLMLQPYGAMILGMVTGVATTLAFIYMEDEQGVLAFHGLPALLGGVSSAVLAALAEDKEGPIVYHKSLYATYPARIPSETSPLLGEILSNYPFLEDKAASRTSLGQAGFQVLGIVVVVLTGFAVAVLNGICLRISARK